MRSTEINQAFNSLGLFPAAEIDRRAKSIPSSTDQSAIPINIVRDDELSASPSAAVKADERMRKDLESKLSNQIAQHRIALLIGRDGLVISCARLAFTMAARPARIPVRRVVSTPPPQSSAQLLTMSL
jgi:chemotaxis protein MotB